MAMLEELLGWERSPLGDQLHLADLPPPALLGQVVRAPQFPYGRKTRSRELRGDSSEMRAFPEGSGALRLTSDTGRRPPRIERLVSRIDRRALVGHRG